MVSLHGRGRLVDAQTVEVTGLCGDKQLLKTRRVVLATGGRPRAPEHLPVDHEHVLDGDSILSMIYLPRSLMVVGSGALAFEYASIFAALCVAVSVLDPNDEPLHGMEYEQNQELLRGFERRGCLYSARAEVLSLHWDGLDVVAQLAGGREARARKALVAAGIEPVLKGVMLARAWLPVGKTGSVTVVPKDAVVLGVAKPFVYCVEPSSSAATTTPTMGTVLPVEVSLGATVEGHVEVRGGVEPGQLVVIRGNERLRPGASVSFQIPAP